MAASPRTVAPVICLTILILSSTGSAMAADWLAPGGGGGRTGRVSLPSPLDRPVVRHEIPTSARETLVAVSRSDGRRLLSLPASEVGMSVADRIGWGLRAPLLAVAGDGALVEPPSAPGARWGKFLPGIAGLQRLSWTTGWGPSGSLQMHAFDDGLDHPRLVWDVEHDGSVYSPLTVVGDIDDDGQNEVVVSTWHGVLVYDIATGAEKYQTKYRETHARHYGSLGLHTDVHGRVYILVVGDFAGHIASLAVRDGTLAPLWYEEFDPQSEQGIDRRFTINRIGPDPTGDFNGDGRAEALMNVFNESGDGKWHLLAYDLEVGERVLDVPDEFVHGHHDVDGDGTPELLTQRCTARAVATNAVIHVRRWNDIVWSHANSRWAVHPLAGLPLAHDTGATRGRETVVTAGGAAVCTTAGDVERTQGVKLSSTGEPSATWRVYGPTQMHLDAVSARDDDILIRVRGPHGATGELSADGRRLSVVESSITSHGAPAPIVLDAPDGPVVVVADTLDTVSAWRVEEEGAERLWTQPGRAMTTQAPQMLGVAAGDIDGDGVAEALVVRETRSGEAELTAYRLDGSEAWAHVVDGYGGRAPVWNEGGVTRWALGHFLHRERLDVLVAVRRSIMHSDETMVIRSDTHETVWRRDILEVRAPWADSQWQHTRGYGGGPMAFADLGGDGLDDIIMCYPAEYSVVDGATGEQMHVMDAGPLPGADGYWVPSGEPLTADLDGDGDIETLWRGAGMLLAIRHGERAELMWRTDTEDGANGGGALADVDGDGRLAVGAAGFRDGFRCYDAATGGVLWRLDGGASPVSNTLAIAVDGVPGDEFVWADGASILAARDGAVLWETTAPANVRHLAPVSVSERSGLVAACENGVVYVLW